MMDDSTPIPIELLKRRRINVRIERVEITNARMDSSRLAAAAASLILRTNNVIDRWEAYVCWLRLEIND